MRQINQRLRDLACHRADTLALQITSTDESRKMFRAVKAMKSTPRPPSLSVQDPEGKFIATDEAKADTISKWFEQRLTDPNVVPLAPFVGPGQALKQPITATEVESAMKLLQNGRAPGPDGISNELLKYAAGTLSEPFAEIINTIFKHITLEADTLVWVFWWLYPNQVNHSVRSPASVQ